MVSYGYARPVASLSQTEEKVCLPITLKLSYLYVISSSLACSLIQLEIQWKLIHVNAVEATRLCGGFGVVQKAPLHRAGLTNESNVMINVTIWFCK